MNVLRSLALAFCCFSHLPAPRVEWNNNSMRYLLMWLPAVGIAVGGFVALWLVFADAVDMGTVLRAVGITLIPLAVTGAFHMDGFMDVVDAQSSHAEPAKKRQILKDSNIGAFAAIGAAAYLLLYFGLACELPHAWQIMVLLACAPVMSRAGSGFASSVFWGNGSSGTLASFRDSSDVRINVIGVSLFFVLAVIGALLVCPLAAALMVVAEIALLAWLNWFAQRNFGGMSGDLAGFFVQLAELVMLACIVIAAKVVGL